MSPKNELRQRLIDARRALPPATRSLWDAAIGAKVLAWLDRHAAARLGLDDGIQIGVYWPIQGEPDLQALYQELARRQMTLGLPVVAARHEALRFAAWSPGEALTRAAHGVPVPVRRDRFIVPQLLLIPCVGYNPRGFRIGYGAGYYDRTLARQPRPLAIGIAYSCTLANFREDAHDIPLDLIVTEQDLVLPPA